MMSSDQETTATRVRSLIREGRVHEALGVLNARTQHRFTGVYRFDPPTLRNVALFDRTNPRLEVGEDTPLRETYCSIVGETGEPFMTADSVADESLENHPARELNRSYCGVLLSTEDGVTFGTLCHFDVVPRPIPAQELATLKEVSSSLADWAMARES